MAETKLPPVTDLKSFGSVSELNSFIDREISELKAQLGEHLRRLEAVKAKAETLVKFENLLSELAKAARRGGAMSVAEEKEFEIGAMKIVVNPSPKQELEILIATVRSLQERIMLLERIKKSLEQLARIQDIEIKLEVLFENEIPTKVFIRMT